MRQLIGALAIGLGLLGGGTATAETVDLELVLLADASGSIDDGEIRFQRCQRHTEIRPDYCSILLPSDR
jgi:hypothetical protein